MEWIPQQDLSEPASDHSNAAHHLLPLQILADELHVRVRTGPKTPEGISRIRGAQWKHGEYSAAAVAERARIRALFRQARALLDSLNTK